MAEALGLAHTRPGKLMSVGTCPIDYREINCRISRLKEIRLLPRAVQRMLEILSGEIVSANDLENFIKYDQALSAKILSLANSAYYGFRGEVETLPRAVMVIGFHRARSICLYMLLMELCSEEQTLKVSLREELWKHSFATAKIAAQIAAHRPWISKEHAYVLGLIHDLGRTIMATDFMEHFQTIRNLATVHKMPFWCAELQYGLTHMQIGKCAAIKWAFPEMFQRVIEFHHTPEKSPSFVPEVTMIALADILANSNGYPELVHDELALSYCSDLYIPEEEWEGHLDGLGRIWVETDQLWTLLG